MAPRRFDWVEIGRVGRELFDGEPSRSPLVQSANSRAMDAEPIQDDDQGLPVNSIQSPQVAHHV